MAGSARGKGAILAVGSHPDDIEIGCGGTLARFVKRGYRVYAMVMTCGGKGGDPRVRRGEQLASTRILGIRDVFWGNFEDTRLPFYDNLTPEIEKVVNKTRPSFVFVHHGSDTHQDHRQVSACTVVATRNIPNVLFYECPTTLNFSPNVYVDIRDFMKLKCRSLACHRSQVMKTNVDRHSIIDIARATATFRGTQCRIPVAEAFSSLRMIVEP
jgi:N-acetylglucosamine malate deacetylase 1